MAAIAAAKLSRERVGRRWLIAPAGRIAVAVAGLCAAGLLAASPGYAGVGHPFITSFEGKHTPAESLVYPLGAAVDEATGEVYIADYHGGPELEFNLENGEVRHVSTSAIDIFSGLGGSYGYLSQIEGKETPPVVEEFTLDFEVVGKAEIKQLQQSSDVAVDQASGRIYVNNHQKEVDVFNATGKYLFDIKPEEEPALQNCGYLGGRLAVDAQGNLYVTCIASGLSGGGVVAEFNSEGKYLSQMDIETTDRAGYAECSATGLAVNASDEIYVIVERELAGSSGAPAVAVDKFNAEGEYVATIDEGAPESAAEPQAVAVDPVTQDVYVGHRRYIAEYGASGELISRFGAPDVNGRIENRGEYGLVVDGATGEVYAVDASDHRVEVFGGEVPAPDVATAAPSALGETVATLSGTVNPGAGEAASYQFEYSTSKTEVEESKGTLSPSTPAGIPAGTTPVPVSASLTGLTPNRTYYYRLLAYNHGGAVRVESEVATFVTTGPPEVSEAFISDAGSTSAVFNADVNPGGLQTTYRVEYGTGTEYGSSTPGVTLGVQGHEGVAVAVTVSGLQPETAYHARLVASNVDSAGPAPSADEAFATFPVNTGLLDGRVYELVTPLDNHDADVYSSTWAEAQDDTVYGTGAEAPFQAAASGEAVTYAGDPSPEGNGAAGGHHLANQYLATRSASGWSQQDIAPPGHNEAFYDAFSSELATGILEAGRLEPRLGESSIGSQEASSLLPEAPAGYRVLYARNDGTGSERALFTGFEGTPPAPGTLTDRFAGASESFETLLFEASAALTERAPSGGGVNDLYESSGGRLSLVNEKPEEAGPEPDASFGAPNDTQTVYSGTGEGAPDYSHDISANGSRVFWTGLKSHELYMSERGAETVQVDAPNEEVGGSGGGGQFWTASSDGGEVFFTDEKRLTHDSTAEIAKGGKPGEPDLYEYDVSKPLGERLSDLTVAPTSGEHADVQGVIGAGEDGSYVYFVADGVLTEAANVEGEKAKLGTCEFKGRSLAGVKEYHVSNYECNMYVWHEGTIEFIASLTDADGQEGGVNGSGHEVGDWVQGVGYRTSEVTPGGGDVVFVSGRRLTGYDNEGASEVYVYDAASRQLSCASCDPSGERIQFSSVLGAAGGVLVPSYTTNRTPRWMSDDGDRVFFDSSSPLVPEDTNGLVDVYEWEREGSGSCHTAGGCVSLLSGGKSDDNSYLLDASANGDNVFFVTRAQLLGEDRDETFNVYDARVEGARPAAETSCSGTGCQGVPGAPPIFATPSSVTFAGVGNFPPPAPAKPATKPKAKSLTRAQKLAQALRACRKKRKGASRTACEKQARKRYPVKTKTKRSTARKGK